MTIMGETMTHPDGPNTHGPADSDAREKSDDPPARGFTGRRASQVIAAVLLLLLIVGLVLAVAMPAIVRMRSP